MKIEIDPNQLRPLVNMIVAEVADRVLSKVGNIPARPRKADPASMGVEFRERKPKTLAEKNRGYVIGEEGLVTKGHAAEALQVSVVTIDRMIRRGDQHAQKMGPSQQAASASVPVRSGS